MEELTIGEIIELVNGELHGEEGQVKKKTAAVAIDSRNVSGGEIFFALHGQTTDGHRFVEDALGMGALAAVIERGNPVPSGPAILVKDTLTALGDLAQGYRKKFDLKAIGITGSTGDMSSGRSR